MSRDDPIETLERQIESLRADMQSLEKALAERKAGGQDASVPPPSPAKADPAAARPAPAPAPAPAPGAASPVESSGPEGYPYLDEIQLTAENPDSPVSSRRAERRSNGRVACALEIEFREDAHFFAGITQDISEGGLFVATYRLLPVGTPVAFGFELPGGTRITGRGEVRWVRAAADGGQRPGIGIAFTDLSPEAMHHVAAFCAARPPLYIEM